MVQYRAVTWLDSPRRNQAHLLAGDGDHREARLAAAPGDYRRPVIYGDLVAALFREYPAFSGSPAQRGTPGSLARQP
jgi:hypothetical protein